MVKKKTVAVPTRDQHDVQFPDRILSVEDVCTVLPLNRSTIWRLCTDGQFPKPVQLSTKRIGWKWSDIEAWITERQQHPIKAQPYFGGDPSKCGRDGMAARWKRKRTNTRQPRQSTKSTGTHG